MTGDRRLAGTLTTALTVAVCVVGAYLAWLGWDQERDVQPNGNSTGPYQPWQVMGLALCIAAVVGWAGWRGNPWVGSLVSTFVVTTCWIVDAATDPPGDGLWPIGAFLVFSGSLGGTLVVALVAAQEKASATRHHVGAPPVRL